MNSCRSNWNLVVKEVMLSTEQQQVKIFWCFLLRKEPPKRKKLKQLRKFSRENSEKGWRKLLSKRKKRKM